MFLMRGCACVHSVNLASLTSHLNDKKVKEQKQQEGREVHPCKQRCDVEEESSRKAAVCQLPAQTPSSAQIYFTRNSITN